MADLIAILLAALAGFFQNGADPARLARSMEQAVLEQQPIPIAAAEVTCSVDDGGRLSGVNFNLEDLTLDPLAIERAEIAVSGVRPRPGLLTFDSIDWTARIDDAALTAALRSHVKKMSDAEVVAKDGAIQLQGTYPVWPLRIPYSVEGQLVVERQTELVFRIARSGVSGVSMPHALNKLIESEINPVYDLAKFAARSKKDLDNAKAKLDYDFMLHVEKITAGDGFLIVEGDA